MEVGGVADNVEEHVTPNDSSAQHEYTYDELMEIVSAAEDGESETISGFTDAERDDFIDALQEYGIYPDPDEAGGGEERSSLPWCSGYWGAHHEDDNPVEQRSTTSGLLYQTMPNCYMWLQM